MKGFEIASVTGGTLFGDGNAEIKSISTDSRKIEEGALFVAIRGEQFDGNRFLSSAFEKGAAVAVGNDEFTPGEGCAYIKVEDGVRALGALARAHREKFSFPVVGVTGSVGKTTTKEMIAAALSEKFSVLKTEGNFNNHIGLPLTVLGLSEKHTAAVIEMGMSAKGEISYLTRIAKPTVAVITNVGLSHIENLGSQENIRDAKLEICEGLSAGGTLFVNGDDPFLRDVAPSGVHVVRFGFQNEEAEVRGEILGEDTLRVDGTTIRVPVTGRHNLYNALAAYAIGRKEGLSGEAVAAGILSYTPDGIRQSEVEIPGGIRVICDYYNASPDSMHAALSMLSKGEATRRIAVLGDMLELGAYSEVSHREIGRAAAERKVDIVLTVGNETKFLAESAEDGGVKTVRHFADNASLAAYLSGILTKGDRILIKGSHGMKMGEVFEKIRG